jgi:serine/alanine adding enzyme
MKVVTDADQMDRSKWSDFILNHFHGNIFQTPEMYDILNSTVNYEPVYIALINEDETILGSLLSYIQKESGGVKGHLSARSIIMAGPIIKDSDLWCLDIMIKEYNKKIKHKAIYAQFRNLWEWNDDEKKIFSQNGYLFEEHLDILFDLRKSESELMMEMHKGRRKNIGRAERVPLEFFKVEENFDYKICIELIKKTYQRIKLPIPKLTYFYNARKYFKNYIQVFAVLYQKKIISCRIVLCYKGLVYDWFAGTDDKSLDQYPNDYLPWKIIQWAKVNGFTVFDFGGAGNPHKTYGVRDYKQKFGGELVNFGRFIFINRPMTYKISRLAFRMWQLLQKK